MKRIILACALALAGAARAGDNEVPKSVVERFTAAFRNVPVDTVKYSEVDGLYEIYTGGRIIYYAPKNDVLLFGEIFSLGGESLTQAKLDRILESKALAIDRSKGLSVGDGAIEVVAFVDPDCGHCAAAASWFEKLNFANVRELVFFMPMEPTSPAYQRALQAVCAPPELRREAMRQVFQRGPTPTVPRFLHCDQGEALLRAQAQVARDAGVNATPTFVVKGQTILGFSQDRLESLLSPAEVTTPLN